MGVVEYSYDLNREEGVFPNPNNHNAVGYITALRGFSVGSPIEFKNDITCWTAYNSKDMKYTGPNTPAGQSDRVMGTMKVVGVMEHFKWDGASGGAIELDFYVSQENAINLKMAQQATLTSTRIQSLSYWMINYDSERKCWYEMGFPLGCGVLSGNVVPTTSPDIDVDLAGVPAKDGLEVMLYKCHLVMGPAADVQYQLHFANNSTLKAVKNWGIVVGTLASDAMK